ncbi:MAG: carbohydrate ABC transporter permease [Clostridiales bacterium]|nr:carbohydrate ABC transporter permease [Clostridiales bacterium]
MTYTVLKLLLFVLLGLFTVLALFPFVWMVSSSLKLETDVFRYPIEWIPKVPHWDNYIKIWQQVPLLVYFKNTAVLSVAVTGLQVLTSSFAAYAFAKMRFRGRDVLFLCYIGTIAIPWQTYMLPQFILMRSVELYDTLMALVVLQSFTAFGVFLMRQFFLSIPNDLSEAARIDGLNEYGIWARIVLPLSKPAIATLSIFTFVATWNDYMGPLIYLRSDSVKTVQVGLRRFIQQYTSQFNLIMAASLCSIIPMVVVFLFLQKYFIEGIATTGIKG